MKKRDRVEGLAILLIGLGVYFCLWLAAGLKFGLLEVAQ